VIVIAPTVYLATSWRVMPTLVLAENGTQVVAALVVVIAAIGTTIATRRLGAVLFLGAVGYGVALLFVIQGAPDLALTQLLIETLALAMFVFVLIRLPSRFEATATRLRRLTRVGMATISGLGAMLLAVWAYSGRVSHPLADDFLARSYPEGGGKNVVNVILTDFRALDTLGEITVLALAAMGTVALVRAKVVKRDEEGEEE
jgi:multicomponent Na+:H+ antiporter subunit A